MNILLVTSVLPCAQGPTGGAVVMFGQARWLAARHNVTVVSFATPEEGRGKSVRALLDLGIDLRTVPRSISSGLGAVPRRVRFACSWLAGELPLRTIAFYSKRLQHTLDEVQRERRLDLVQVEDNAMAVYEYDKDVPAILIEHEVRDKGQEIHPTTVWMRPLLQADDRRWQAYQKQVWARAAAVQTFTLRDADVIRNSVPTVAQRVFVNPFGVELPSLEREQTADSGAIVFVGSFLHPPNVDAALWLSRQIMPQIWSSRPDAHLTLVGAHPPPAVAKCAGDRVTVTGHVPFVEPYLESASVVMAPLRLGGGMRVKVLTAMALGKAVVATPLATAGLVSTHNLPLAIGSTADELALHVLDLLNDGSGRRDLGLRARAYVEENHSWDAYGKRLEGMYDDVLAGSCEEAP